MTRKTTTQSQRRAHILDFGYCYPLGPRVVQFVLSVGSVVFHCFPV